MFSIDGGVFQIFKREIKKTDGIWLIPNILFVLSQIALEFRCGEMTELERSMPGKRVRSKGPVGSSPTLSAIKKLKSLPC